MSGEKPKINTAEHKSPTRTVVGHFRSRSLVDEYRDIARIHFREARKLYETAIASQAEDMMHEVHLLMDLAIARHDKAMLYEKLARGEGHDPIVAEILDSQQEQRENFILAEGQVAGRIDEHDNSLTGRYERALAWVSRKQYSTIE
jgi:hypothetical protein